MMLLKRIDEDNMELWIPENYRKDELSLLIPNPSNEDGDNCYDYNHIRRILKAIGVYEGRYDPSDYMGETRKLESFTEEERKILMPYAFMLACLDGNAFRTGQMDSFLIRKPNSEPSEELISQYIPDAWKILTANSANMEELKTINETGKV